MYNISTVLPPLCVIGAINNDTYERMDTSDIFKYMKTMERKHPRHRARYSHTAWLHSTIPDPIQNGMIDRYMAKLRMEMNIALTRKHVNYGCIRLGNPDSDFRTKHKIQKRIRRSVSVSQNPLLNCVFY